MAVTLDLILQKPVSVLNAPANINFKAFFTNLGKAVVSGSFGDMKGAAEYGLDALGEIGLQDKPEQAAWLLVSRSLMQALTTQVEDYQDLLGTNLDDVALADLAERVEYTLNAVEISIDASFFERPQNLPLLDDFQSALVFWLKGLGMNDHQAEAFHYRLKGQFVLALHKEWGERPESYRGITEQIDTPFTKATLEERSWQQYNAWLQEQANARVFGEAFGLRQIYINLRAYYEEKKDDEDKQEQQKTRAVLCDLHREIENWISKFNKDDSLRVISGGPGSGKSSFAKVLAADLTMSHKVPVLFIPLHHFNLNDDLIQAIGSFVRNEPYLRNNPLDPKDGQKRLLMIFDGLDELSMQGKAATDTAQQFVDEVIRSLDRYNNNGYKWQVIITGRELSIQANSSRLRKSHQVLHILPYLLTGLEKDRFRKISQEEFFPNKKSEAEDNEKENMLNIDQRNIWWEKFGKAKGMNYSGMPSTLANKNLLPITREPLLNYLISLSYERNEVVFDENTSLNSIYFDLLKAVHERRYEDHQHAITHELSFGEFMRVLEEIALAVWHGNGRTASARYLYERCKENRLDRYLEKFSSDAKQGVVRLLTAFYFREFGQNSQGDKTFEFTHKSFGEYLAARRIIKQVEIISEEVERYENGSHGGWSPETAYIEWVKVCGPTGLDEYIFQFIKDEIAICADKEKVIEKWQKTFLHLLHMVVRNGSPMEKIGLTTFSEMLTQSRNAEEALLAIHYACAIQTLEVLDPNWGDQLQLFNWLSRVLHEGTIINYCLGYLNFGCNFSFCNLNLFEGNLHDSIFMESELTGTDLYSSNVDYACFVYSELNGIKLNGSSIIGTDFEDSSLIDASFSMANITDANFERANLANANFKYANILDANFKGADLSGANFTGAYIENGNFDGANLTKAIFEDSHLINIDFSNSQLCQVSCTNSSINYSNFTSSDIRSASIKRSNLNHSNFKNAKLDGAYIGYSTFKYTNMEGVSLTGANASYSDFKDASFENSIIIGVNLEYSELIGVSFKNANIEYANFTGTIYEKEYTSESGDNKPKKLDKYWISKFDRKVIKSKK